VKQYVTTKKETGRGDEKLPVRNCRQEKVISATAATGQVIQAFNLVQKQGTVERGWERVIKKKFRRKCGSGKEEIVDHKKETRRLNLRRGHEWTDSEEKEEQKKV
jgi:hypothetical protein